MQKTQKLCELKFIENDINNFIEDNKMSCKSLIINMLTINENKKY